MKTFIISTLGCKVNQYESEFIAGRLRDKGYLPAHKGEPADLCIINTCTVTGKASMQSRQAVRKAIRTYPNARIVVTGCYAQTEPDDLKKISGIHDVIGQTDKHTLAEVVHSPHRDSEVPSLVWSDISRKSWFDKMDAVASGERTRPFLKIQDGCNDFCTYCIVPYARGRSRSMPVGEVIENLQRIKEAGYHEVVFTGIHLGCFGQDLTPKTNLYELLSAIEDSEALTRIRLSSIEPAELSEEIIRLVARSKKICRHFHIPLQSGDDKILKRMGRPYKRAFFKDLVLKINHLIPDAAIGVDTLIGFPGETDEAFEQTFSLIDDLPVSYLHVFPFSPRKGTPAAQYPNQVQQDLVKSRCRKMRALGKRKKKAFHSTLIGKEVEILVEEKRDSATGRLKGLTYNYVPVLIKGEDYLKNTMVRCVIEEAEADAVVTGHIS